MGNVMDKAAAMAAAFGLIHREDRWTNGSGPGSHPDSTIEYRAFLARFMEANEVGSVTDLGCGDWQFSRYIDWSRASYTGLDVVPASSIGMSNFMPPLRSSSVCSNHWTIFLAVIY
jgi:hypothetical protein